MPAAAEHTPPPTARLLGPSVVFAPPDGGPAYVSVLVDRGLKSGRLDYVALTPAEAVRYAHELLGRALAAVAHQDRQRGA